MAADPDAVFLGGGTNLVDLMRLGVATPGAAGGRLGPVPASAELDSGGLLVGAGVRNSDLAADPRIRRAYPMLSQALLSGASGQLRNMATVGGNLLQRTRCLYFQDISKPCNKRENGSGCPARTGIHRDLGVLGTSPACIATHPSDMAVALAALDASVLDRRAGRDRRAVSLTVLPAARRRPHPRHHAVHGELITAVELPPPSPLFAELRLSQGPRPGVLRVRGRFRRGGHRRSGGVVQRRAAGVRRRRAAAVAGPDRRAV